MHHHDQNHYMNDVLERAEFRAKLLWKQRFTCIDSSPKSLSFWFQLALTMLLINWGLQVRQAHNCSCTGHGAQLERLWCDMPWSLSIQWLSGHSLQLHYLQIYSILHFIIYKIYIIIYIHDLTWPLDMSSTLYISTSDSSLTKQKSVKSWDTNFP